MIAQHRPEPVDVTPGDDPPCESWCASREQCVTCEGWLCPEHEPDAVVECADRPLKHHADDCARTCVACALEARDDAAADRADAIRKGEL